MLLAIDIGNTNITYGLFKGNKLLVKFNIPTKGYSRQALKQRLGKTAICDTIICSVVPQKTKALAADCRVLLNKKPYIIGKDIRVPLKNLYRKPAKLGQDRLVNAYAGVKLYGEPLIVVDFGTTVTFDIVSKNKEYLGGLIFPGLNISLESLAKNTALLPKIRLKRPRELVGRDTKSGILSGIVYGFAMLTDNLNAKIKNEIGPRFKVIGTGGNINFIAKYCESFYNIDQDLTLKGINLLYQESVE